MSPTPHTWTVTLDLLTEGEVELSASWNGNDRGRNARRCSIQEAFRELEVLFECTGDANFVLAVRAPAGPWCHLATRRFRLALFFLTAQYERAFVRNSPVAAATQRHSTRPQRRPSEAPVQQASEGSEECPAFARERG